MWRSPRRCAGAVRGGAKCCARGLSGLLEGRGDGCDSSARGGQCPDGRCTELPVPVVRFCGRRFEGGEVTASFLFDGHAEGAQDAPGSFDDSNADSGAVGDGLAGGGDAAPGLSLCQGGMCDGDSECCFGADGVFLAEFGAGGGELSRVRTWCCHWARLVQMGGFGHACQWLLAEPRSFLAARFRRSAFRCGRRFRWPHVLLWPMRRCLLSCVWQHSWRRRWYATRRKCCFCELLCLVQGVRYPETRPARFCPFGGDMQYRSGSGKLLLHQLRPEPGQALV